MDDLLDLNWGSSNSSNKSANTRVNAVNGSSAFDSLARLQPASANYYNSNTNAAPNVNARAVSPSNPIKPSSDAFSSLFEGAAASSNSSKASNAASMTMQQRLALQKSGSGGAAVPSASPASGKGAADPWDFDMLASSSSPAAAASASKPAATMARASSPFDDLADFGLGAPSSFASTSAAVTATSSSTRASPSISAKHSVNYEQEDDVLGLLGKPVPTPTTRRSPPTSSQPPLHAPQPVHPPRSAALASTSSASLSRPPSRAVPARTPSPPPHILGQVVMLGFSVQQARLALAATLGGKQKGQWDVEGALEILASDGAASAERERDAKGAESRGNGRKGFADSSDDEERPISRGAVKTYIDTSPRASRRPQDRAKDTDRQFGNASPGVRPDDQQQGADLLAQASVFGSSMLKSAGAYWKTSRAQIAKAVEENKFIQTHIQQVASASGSRSGTPTNGRPKWMTADMDEGEEVDGSRIGGAAGFRDTDGGSEGHSTKDLPSHPSQQRRSQRLDSSKIAEHSSRTQQPPVAEVNLFGDDGDALPPHPSDRAVPPISSTTTSDALRPVSSRANGLKAPEPEKKAYVSPHRRKAPSPSPAPATPSRPSRPARVAVSASTTALSTSAQHRQAGNEHFKLGAYGDAVSCYSKALSALPDNHLGRVAVLNNLANARLKNGEEKAAAADAGAALTILLGREAEKASKEDYREILAELGGEKELDAYDALGKAMSRRARAWEGIEKWAPAMRDWQLLIELGDARVSKSAGGVSVIGAGLARCRRAIDPPAPAAAPARSAAASTVRRAPAAVSSRPPASFAALNALRAGSAREEAEKVERQDLKDSVDARIEGWKGGKEANLRALLASLDTVLWEGSGWAKCGMHELITEGQLKIRYMKAIAKVHPDKISKDASTEQKMIADSVFSALNDAWNAKP